MTARKRPAAERPPGPIAYGSQVLPDFDAGKVRESARLAEFLQGLTGPDLLRVVSSSIHEFVHRWPHRSVDELVAATRQAIDDAHKAGWE